MPGRINRKLMKSQNGAKAQSLLLQPFRPMLNNSYLMIFLFSMITIICVLLIFRLPLNFTDENVYFSANPDELGQYQSAFSARSEDAIVVAFCAKDVFSNSVLVTIDRLSQKIAAMPGVREVISLTNARDLTSSQQLTLGEYLNRYPNSSYGLERFKQAIVANQQYHHYLISEDGQTNAIIIKLHRLSFFQSGLLAKKLTTLLQQESDLQFHLAGKHILNFHLQQYFVKYLLVLTVIVFLIILILFFIFENPGWVLISVVSLVLAVIWTLGLYVILGWKLDANTALMLPFVIAFATGIVVQVLTRYQKSLSSLPAKTRDQAHSGANGKRIPAQNQAFGSVWPQIARSIIFASLATALVLFILSLSKIPSVKMAGIFLPISIAVILFITLTIVPILMLRFRIRTLSQPTDPVFNHLIKAFGQISLQDVSPLPILVIFLLIFITGWFALGVKTQTLDYQLFHPETIPHRDHVFVESRLFGTGSFEISLRTTDSASILTPDNLNTIESLAEFLRQVDGVDKVISILDYLPSLNTGSELADLNQATRGNRYVLSSLEKLPIQDLVDTNLRSASIVVYTSEHDVNNIQTIFNKIRSFTTAAFGNAPVEITLAGNLMRNIQFLHTMTQDSKKLLLLIAGGTFLVSLILFRSLTLAVIGLIPALFVLIANLGLAGFLQIGIHPLNLIVFILPLALTVNDTFYFFYLYRNAKKSGLHTEEAIIEVLSITASPTILTGFVVASSFLVLAAANFLPIRALGILIPVSMFNAILANLIFVPVLIHIFKPIQVRKRLNNPESVRMNLTFPRESDPGNPLPVPQMRWKRTEEKEFKYLY